MPAWVQCALCKTEVEVDLTTNESNPYAAPYAAQASLECKKCVAAAKARQKLEVERTPAPKPVATVSGQLNTGSSVEIIPGLFMGDAATASLPDALRSLGVTHIVNATTEIPTFYQKEFDYLRVPVEDSSGGCIYNFFENARLFIVDARSKIKNGKVLVHCQAGRSRSAAIVLAYLTKDHNLSLKEACILLKAKCPVLSSNRGFLRDLMKWEREIYDSNSITITELKSLLSSS
ncbi:hypothetical protein CYMTET_4074 [Cymbomonas tetramitiformis]|uniref:Protein-serine/threonine phosphatase n=1 Tax=Cymbomonas tetramitiformis TaxID=36881 RepID=A0AAE0LKF8_9CHLO|nr:hypothetical protein CYMTET_35897 [Cymbomonas tetramitiformis]KAK3288452.1 hypothetical protein CYMTET_4074 [Cymbomonas tetramitiformis]|eukprot:gene17420-20733_t